MNSDSEQIDPRQSMAWLTRSTQMLWDSFLNGEGLFRLMQVAAAVLSANLVVKTAGGKIYHMSPDDNAFPLSDRTASRLIGWCQEQLRDTSGSVLLPAPPQEAGGESMPFGAACADIQLRSRSLGCIAAFRTDASMTQVDQNLISNISGMLAVLMDSDRKTQGSHDVPYASLFLSLLKGEEVAPKLIREYIKTLPQSEERTMSILVIDCREQGEREMRSLRDVCSTMVTCSMRAIYQGYVVLLYHGRERYALEEHHNFLEYLARNGYQCGMSRNLKDLSRISKYYDQAKAAVRLGPKLLPGKTLYSYEECAAFHVIELAAQQIQLDDLISPRILKLRTYDREKGANLLETLRTYLAHVSNLNTAADLLNIHRNTLFYRLRKIEQITGWDLTKGENLNEIFFFLKVMDLMDQM